MAFRPGDQDGDTDVVPRAVTIPAGCVVNVIEVIADPAVGKAGATVDVTQFATTMPAPIFVPPGAAYKDEPKRYVGDGVKQIIFAGDLLSWDVTWKVL